MKKSPVLDPMPMRDITQHLLRDPRGRWRLETGHSRGELLTAPQELGAASTVVPSWIAQWTAPLRWKKFSDNPIYGPHKSGAWDSWTNGVSIVPASDGRTYRMYYAGTT